MDTTLSLITIAILPVIMSLILQLIFTSKKVESMSYLSKQLIAGFIFGFLAIMGTEYGVPIEGAIINARDAAPLCAGLIFGPIAGILSGVIGGIERWFAVYWGAGYYTRLACSISTCVTGVLAAAARQYLFDGKTPNWDHSMIIGVVAEVFHMLMIFITNTSDVRRAFTFVEACTIPMVLINSIAVALAVMFTTQLDKKHAFDGNSKNHSISAQIIKNLIIVVISGFVITSLFSYNLQNRISQEDTKQILDQSLIDVENEIEDQCDEALLRANRLVAEYYVENKDVDLNELAGRFNVSEIDVVDSSGIVIASNDEVNVGFDMASGEQSAEFLKLLDPNGPDEIVQAFMPSTFDETIYLKFSGVRIPNGFVQTAFNGYLMSNEINELISNVAANRHVGENGYIVVLDRGNQVVSSSNGAFNGDVVDPDDIVMDQSNDQPYTVYSCKIKDVDYFYMFTSAENYTIVSLISKDEANFNKSISVYLSNLTQTIIFGILFAMIYGVIKRLVVDDIRKVNDSLELITEGKLDTVIDIKTNEEFKSLSDGINSTVEALKRYIAEANERIDSELRYAKEIQFSALPSNFPAFPERNEFDIYALMDPAKEVGGDFYDFYMINQDTLVFLVADVAGKGIPASLFMMRAKSILKTFAENNIGVADIFTNANYELCDGNDAGMFVTAWMGFLNLRTGELKYANAGHNRPLIKRKNGEYEYLKGPAGFVLAGMEGIVYKEQATTLEPGDEIFLYTDGVVEATNVNKELYGDDRLKECINSHLGESSEDICNHIKSDVDEFYKGADQFDDITELSVKFLRYTLQDL